MNDTDYTYLQLYHAIESRPSLSFTVIQEVLSSHNVFVQLDFILKISSTFIDLTFKKQNMFIGNDSVLISISRKQYISSLSVLPYKSVTPLSTINTASALSYAGQPKLFQRLPKCATGKTVYCHHGVHYQRIITNVIYYYLSFSTLKLNALESGLLIEVSTIFYITTMPVLSFNSPLEMVSCFVLGKGTVSKLQASGLDEESKGSRSSRWASGNLKLWRILRLFSVYVLVLGL